jgi:hypothetical protein
MFPAYFLSTKLHVLQTAANEWPFCAMKKLHVGCSKIFVIEEKDEKDKKKAQGETGMKEREKI